VNAELTDNVEILRNAVIDYRDRVVPDIWAERNLYREVLEWIVDHSQEFTQEIHGYNGYGQALGAVHNRARNAVDPPAASATKRKDA
jgi:hypothetical protein